MAHQYWLLKSEPETYSIDDLKRDKKTLWTGVRNYQARNFMMPAPKTKPEAKPDGPPTMNPGDLFFFYHSNAEPSGCAGLGRIEKIGIADPEQFDKKSEMFDPKASKTKPIWFCAEVAFEEKFSRLVSLNEIRAEKSLEKMALLQKGSRLSVQPVSPEEFARILQMAKK